MKLAGKTDKGSYRSENQDNYRAARLPDDTVWAVVCDGMGGAAAGRLASQIATDALEDCFAETICPIICEGDAIGAVALFSRDPKARMGEVEQKLALAAANFLGRQMEQ